MMIARPLGLEKATKSFVDDIPAIKQMDKLSQVHISDELKPSQFVMANSVLLRELTTCLRAFLDRQSQFDDQNLAPDDAERFGSRWIDSVMYW